MAFASFVCYHPPQALVSVFDLLQAPKEWRGQFAIHYQTLAIMLFCLAILFHLSAGMKMAAFQAVVPTCVLIDLLLTPCSLEGFQRRRNLVVLVMVPVHFLTAPLRASGQLEGAGWPAVMLFPVTGALLHDSVGIQMAEALLLNAMLLADTEQTTNGLRVVSLISTLLGFIVLLAKILLLHHLPFNQELDGGSGPDASGGVKQDFSGSICESSFAKPPLSTAPSGQGAGDTHEHCVEERSVQLHPQPVHV